MAGSPLRITSHHYSANFVSFKFYRHKIGKPYRPLNTKILTIGRFEFGSKWAWYRPADGILRPTSLSWIHTMTMIEALLNSGTLHFINSCFVKCSVKNHVSSHNDQTVNYNLQCLVWNPFVNCILGASQENFLPFGITSLYQLQPLSTYARHIVIQDFSIKLCT